ncbi:MAG: glutathione synthase [Gammaproteobacteria bacterium]|nr:MAG: glutathione synthase [Gammaproteobacteria bacterium]
MNRTLLVIMDPIEGIKPYKDSTFAMLLEAQARGWSLSYAERTALSQRDGRSLVRARPLEVWDRQTDWFQLGETMERAIDHFPLILMRKDPPFDMDYIYTTYLLDQPAAAGSLVVNHPAALRNANEKLAAARFPQFCPPVLVSNDMAELNAFIEEQGDTILKPLEGMGGASVFRVRPHDPNRTVIIETLTRHGARLTMAQRYIPEISEGDKRILVIDGEPVPWALARIPADGETRGNLAAGGRGVGVPLNERDREIVAGVSPMLRDMGILFAGLDVIGDYLTEINITSPTCIRELDKLYSLNIAATLFDRIEQILAV